MQLERAESTEAGADDDRTVVRSEIKSETSLPGRVTSSAREARARR